MKLLVTCVLVGLAAFSRQSTGHPFDARRISPSIDTFAIVTPVTGARPAGLVVQTIARDRDVLRVAIEYQLGQTTQRVEMAMNGSTLAPLAHHESLTRRGLGTTRGEVYFRDGRARGAYILSKNIVDVPLDSGIVDDDMSTVLLAALPLDSAKSFVFRTFAAPGKVEITRVLVAGLDTVSVPAGRFEAYRLTVMARDTSSVFVSTALPRRVVLVRLGDGSQEMRLINR